MSDTICIPRAALAGLSAKERLLFLYLCSVAAWGAHDVWGVTVETGQYLTTVRTLAEEMEWPKSTLHDQLAKLIARGLITSAKVKVRGRRCADAILLSVERAQRTAVRTAEECSNQQNYNELQGHIKQSSDSGSDTARTAVRTAVRTANVLNNNTLEVVSEQPVGQQLGHTQYIDTTTSVVVDARAHECDDPKAEAMASELSTLLQDGRFIMQLHSMTGRSDDYKLVSYIREFAQRLSLEGCEEHGWRLFQHYANWLNFKFSYERKQNQQADRDEQARRHNDEVNEFCAGLMRGDIKFG